MTTPKRHITTTERDLDQLSVALRPWFAAREGLPISPNSR